MSKTIELAGPVTVTLSPVEMLTIVTALKELPYKHVQAVIDHLFEACQPAPAEAPPP